MDRNWTVVEQGGGRVIVTHRRPRAFSGNQTEESARRDSSKVSTYHLSRPSSAARSYTNAQLSDQSGFSGWNPPLTMVVHARFSHGVNTLRGTAGFGFWNAALGPGMRSIRPPRAVWFFFGAPPHDVPLAFGVPGHGFKAAVLDAQRPAFFALLPTAPLGILVMRVPALYRRLWPIAQRAIGVDEALLDSVDLVDPHTYVLRWEKAAATFSVDDRAVICTRTAPAGPLHFVAWIDNSYAIATPQGRLGLGTVETTEEQWLELDVSITPG